MIEDFPDARAAELRLRLMGASVYSAHTEPGGGARLCFSIRGKQAEILARGSSYTLVLPEREPVELADLGEILVWAET